MANRRRPCALIGACALTLSLSSEALAAEADDPVAETPQGEDLSELSIEQLAQVTVRSASKREESLGAAPAALYVVTGGEIEDAGVTSLPEALRLAPNLSVQQVDAYQYSISARGFNGIQAGNKVLALIDGRTIYTPLASTVFWNHHWPLLEDVEQIEVISGPGGTLYGPNAVNGVINVTTRDAQDTLGILARGTAGPDEATAAARYGFAIGGEGAARVYVNWHEANELPTGIGSRSDDDYRGWQAGFRTDFVSDLDHFTVQGDLFRTDGETLEGDGARGHYLLARWGRTLSPTSSLQLQAYYDYFRRDVLLVDDEVRTIDAEAQFNTTLGSHDIVAGGGVRTTRDSFSNELNAFVLNPVSRRLWVYNGFVQDHFRLSDQLALIAGVKVERSTFSGWEFLPNLRLAWQPNSENLLWAAVSRAVRTPSRIDRQLEAPPFLGAAVNFRSEKLVAVEAGYRGQPSRTFSLSVNGFVNFYDDLRTTEFTGGIPLIELRNNYKGKTYGIEAWGGAQVAPRWQLQLGVSTLWKDIREVNGADDLAPRNSLGNDPKWQVVGRSDFELSPRLRLNLNARAVGRIEQAPQIGSYVEAGGELSYRVRQGVDLFVAGRNLLHKYHVESNDPEQGQLARRTITAGARARF